MNESARELVGRECKLAVRVVIWTLIMCFVVGGEVRSIATNRFTYDLVIRQNLVVFGSQDRFIEPLESFLGEFLNHAPEDVAVRHAIAPAYTQFFDVVLPT